MPPTMTATALPAGGGSGFTVGAAALIVLAVGTYELARRGRLFSPDR